MRQILLPMLPLCLYATLNKDSRLLGEKNLANLGMISRT